MKNEVVNISVDNYQGKIPLKSKLLNNKVYLLVYIQPLNKTQRYFDVLVFFSIIFLLVFILKCNFVELNKSCTIKSISS